MSKKNKVITYPPTIFNVFKPARMTSYDVIRHFKRNLPEGYGKIGHFGTLDPFASGVLLIGVAGAARLNDYIHDYAPKTYLAVGKLGVETATGDLTEEPIQVDDSEYLNQNIATMPVEFIQKQLQEKFLGEYWQAPHQYSAAKFEGKPLHEWAREGVEIKKEKKLRHVHSLEVVKYQFPYLSLRVTVSSGTYVRTLFSDCANHLGTIGCLVSLVREEIGMANFKNAIFKKDWPLEKNWNYENFGLRPWELLSFPMLELGEKQAKLFSNGVQLRKDQIEQYLEGLQWVKGPDRVLGLGQGKENQLKAQLNFAASSS
jgi:tRNA pseudouridine55 synthase